MRIVKTIGVRWIALFILVAILAIFNPSTSDFTSYISSQNTISINLSGDDIFTDSSEIIDEEVGDGEVSMILDSAVISGITFIDTSNITRSNLLIFSIYEYDKGDRVEKYIGIFNHFIKLM